MCVCYLTYGAYLEQKEWANVLSTQLGALWAQFIHILLRFITTQASSGWASPTIYGKCLVVFRKNGVICSLLQTVTKRLTGFYKELPYLMTETAAKWLKSPVEVETTVWVTVLYIL